MTRICKTLLSTTVLGDFYVPGQDEYHIRLYGELEDGTSSRSGSCPRRSRKFTSTTSSG